MSGGESAIVRDVASGIPCAPGAARCFTRTAILFVISAVLCGMADQEPRTPGKVETLPKSRGGQDVVGQRTPTLEFDRWINGDGDEPVETRGRVTLYRWWTDGCEHCEKTLPAVEALRGKYGPRGLAVVAAYHPKPPRPVADKDVRAAARALGYDGAVAIDLDWSELKRFYLSKARREATSASFVVDRDGVIRFAHPGPRYFPSGDAADAEHDRDYRLLERAVESLLADQ
jgi:thiol-disulfide isomerase/thioredoxin